MAAPQSRCWQLAAFQAWALGHGNAPAETEPSRAEGGLASSLTIGSALPVPAQAPQQSPCCGAGPPAVLHPPPRHADALPGMQPRFLPQGREGVQILLTGVSAGTGTIGNSQVIFQGSHGLVQRHFLTEGLQTAHSFPSLPSPDPAASPHASQVTQDRASPVIRSHREAGPGASQVPHHGDGTKSPRFTLTIKKEMILQEDTGHAPELDPI